MHSRKFSDLPKSVVSDNYDDADAAANAPANGLASGWLNKLPISDTKSLAKPKKRSVFKKRYFVLNQIGPSTAKLSYFPNEKMASKPTSEWLNKDNFITISPVTSVTRVDDNCLQLKSGGKVLTVQPIAGSHSKEAKAKQEESRECWENIFTKYILKFHNHELETRRLKRRRSSVMRRRINSSGNLAANPQPYCKGFMYKLPRGHKKKQSGWKRRYFVLVVDGLHYYTKEQGQFKDNYKADLAFNSPEYLGSFTIHPYTQITQTDLQLSDSSGCPKSISIENENNEVMILHPDAPEPVSGTCEVLQRWLDALGAAVNYSREMFRQQNLVRTPAAQPLDGVKFSLVIGHEQPINAKVASPVTTHMSAGLHHEYFSLALDDTIGFLVRRIVKTLDLKWLHNPAILFRGPAGHKVGFLGDEDDVALHPDRSMHQLVAWAGKAKAYACFIAPEALDWALMMPWEFTAAHTRRLLVHDVPLELIDTDDRASVELSKSAKKKNKSATTLRRQRSIQAVRVTKAKLSVVLMLRRKTRYSWHMRLEIMKVVGLDPNRDQKSEMCEVECFKHNVDPMGEFLLNKVAETHGKKATEVVKDMQVPKFTKANQPERFDFTITSPNITSLFITLKSGGRTLATVNLEPLDIMSFASPVFFNQVEKHVELAKEHVLYEMPLHNQLIPEKLSQSALSNGKPGEADQQKFFEVGKLLYTLNTELLRPKKDDPNVFEGWLIGRLDRIDVPASSPLLKTGEFEARGYVCLLPGAARPECRHMTDLARMTTKNGAASFEWRDGEGVQLHETFFFWLDNAECSKLRIKFNFHSLSINSRSRKDLLSSSSYCATTTISIPYAGDVCTQHHGTSRRRSVSVSETAIQAEKRWRDKRIEQLARVFMRFDAQEPGYIANHLLLPFITALQVQPWDIPSSWDEASAISFVEVARWWTDQDTRIKLQRTEEYVKRFDRWGTDGELNTEGVRRLCKDLGLDPDRAVQDMSLNYGAFVSRKQFMTWAIAQETGKEFSFQADDPEADLDDGSLLDSLQQNSTQLSTDVKAALESLTSQLTSMRHMVAEVQQTRHEPDIDAVLEKL